MKVIKHFLIVRAILLGIEAHCEPTIPFITKSEEMLPIKEIPHKEKISHNDIQKPKPSEIRIQKDRKGDELMLRLWRDQNMFL